jgi:hypothetical protein
VNRFSGFIELRRDFMALLRFIRAAIDGPPLAG